MAALSMRKLRLAFGGVVALDGVDLDLARGGVLGLVGPNGSGKTSVVNVVSGLYRPDEGRVAVGGFDITGAGARAAVRAGVARTFQNLRFYGRMTLRENLQAACDATAPWHHAFWIAPAVRRAQEARLREQLAVFGLAGRVDDTLDRLTLVEQRLLEIARALACSPDLLLLDEPAAGMTPRETKHLERVLAERVLPGRSVLLIEHKIGLVAALCSEVGVMQAGRVIARGAAAEILADRDVRRVFTGEAA